MIDLRQFLNIPFIEGIQDCYSLARQFFLVAYGLELTNYARPTNWYLTGEYNFFVDYFQQEGFYEVKESPNRVAYGDALLMVMGRTSVPNHVAIYVGQNQILHSLTGGISRLDSYTDRWRSRVYKVLRHPVASKSTPVEVLDLLKKAPPHIRARGFNNES